MCFCDLMGGCVLDKRLPFNGCYIFHTSNSFFCNGNTDAVGGNQRILFPWNMVISWKYSLGNFGPNQSPSPKNCIKGAFGNWN